MAKKSTKPALQPEPEKAVIEEKKEAPERIFYVEGYGNVMAKDELDAHEKAKAIIAKIRG